MEVDPQRVRHLLRRALRRPSGERRDFLVDACGGDLDLLAATRQALAREEDAPATATVEPEPVGEGHSTGTEGADAGEDTGTTPTPPTEAEGTASLGLAGATATVEPETPEPSAEPTTDAVDVRRDAEAAPSTPEGVADVAGIAGATATLEPDDRVELARVLDTAVSWADYQPELGPKTPEPEPGTGPTATFEPDELRRRAAVLETLDPVGAAEMRPQGVKAVADERTRLPTLAETQGESKPADHPHWIGPYKLLELLGEGGMGSVYLAEQRRPLKRQVALKLMQTGRMSPTARARFDAERQALARLDHPAIGRILDAGATDEGELFFAMERVEGERITHYCDRHRLTIEQRVTLMVEVCRGVEHAHRKQILHRDIKPSNILVTEVDGRPVPKIIDFGIAKALDQPLTDRTLVTAGWILGTPVYMSPEALEGDDVDTRSDIYALGMVLYEVLSGERPFEIQDSGLSQILKHVLESDPPRPSDRFATVARETRTELAAQRNASPPELRRRLAGDLDWIVLRCLAKDREKRYGSAAELAADLERHLRFEPVSAGPPGLRYRLEKFARRHRTALTMAALLVLLVVVAGVLQVRSRWQADRLTQAGQTMTREVERIEWLLRVTHQLPPQSVVRDRHRIRQAMGRIEQQMDDLGRLGLGPGPMPSAGAPWPSATSKRPEYTSNALGPRPTGHRRSPSPSG